MHALSRLECGGALGPPDWALALLALGVGARVMTPRPALIPKIAAAIGLDANELWRAIAAGHVAEGP